MADLTLQLLFGGLVAFSPDAQGTKATVLLLNDINSHHMPHQAFLSVQSGFVDEPNSDFLFVVDPTAPGMGYKRTFVGSGYELSIKGLPSGGTLSYSNCRTLAPREGATAVPVCLLKSKELRTTDYQADSDSLAGTSAKTAMNVGLRFVATLGKLQPYEQTGLNFLTARKVGWTPPGTSTAKSQYVPELMEWQAPKLDASEVTLVLRPLGGGADREIKIKSIAGEPIQVYISNDPNIRDFCAMGGSARHTVAHLGRLARFSGGKEVTSAVPVLLEAADTQEIDNFCNGRGAGGRQPIVCYGSEMPEP